MVNSLSRFQEKKHKKFLGSFVEFTENGFKKSIIRIGFKSLTADLILTSKVLILCSSIGHRSSCRIALNKRLMGLYEKFILFFNGAIEFRGSKNAHRFEITFGM